VIKLLEHEGKRILAAHGIPIPPGALYPDLPPGTRGPFVVKAQVYAGGRGKAGGIQIVDDAKAIADAADRIQEMTIGGDSVRAVYVEAKIEHEHEFYLAAMIDRDAGRPVLLASTGGGIDIESVAAEHIVRVEIDPLVGLRPYGLADLTRRLGLDGDNAKAFADTATRVLDALEKEDAELVEINPLVLDKDGALIAADAKVILDEDAGFRHDGRVQIPQGSEFERSARALDVIGIEFDGHDVAAVMNGAGMTMATLDQLVAMGASVRALVELHGAMAQGPQHVSEVIELICGLEPKVLLLNFYMQFRTLDTIAEGLAMARQRSPIVEAMPVVVRMRGLEEDKARTILMSLNCEVTGNFEEACRRTIAVARAQVTG
jgi:succinyl-CoA synthetase beta subunit